jgi:YesN/AraC family two-component response regulator
MIFKRPKRTIKVLLVEDEEKVRRTTEDWLKCSSEDQQDVEFKILSASNADEALQKYEKYNCEIVLMDMILREVNKNKTDDIDTLIKNIKDINEKVHIIAVSGFVEHKTIQNCMKKKLIDKRVFYKPVDVDELIDYMKELQSD